MTDELDPKQDKRKKALGPLGSWLKKQNEKANIRDMARAVAQSVAARAVAGLALGVGGAVVADATNLMDDAGEDTAQVERQAAAVKERLESLNADLDRVQDLLSELDGQAGVLHDAVDALETADGLLAEEADLVRAEALAAAQAAANAAANVAADVKANAAKAAADVAAVADEVDALALTTDAAVNDLDLDVRAVRARASEAAAQADAVGAELDAAVADLAEQAGEADARLDDVEDVASQAAADAALALEQVEAVGEQVTAIRDDLDVLADDLDTTVERLDQVSADLDALDSRVDDLEDRIEAEESETPVAVGPGYDDTEVRNRLDALEAWQDEVIPTLSAAYVILPSVSGDGAVEPTTTSPTVTFTTRETDGTVGSNGRIQYRYIFSFTPNFTSCSSVTLYIDGFFTRNISANNSAGRLIAYSATAHLAPGEHTIYYEVNNGPSNCLIIEPSYELRAKG